MSFNIHEAGAPSRSGSATASSIRANPRTECNSVTALRHGGAGEITIRQPHDIAQFAKRVLVFRDGKVRKDDPVLNRPKACEVLKSLPTLED